MMRTHWSASPRTAMAAELPRRRRRVDDARAHSSRRTLPRAKWSSAWRNALTRALRRRTWRDAPRCTTTGAVPASACTPPAVATRARSSPHSASSRGAKRRPAPGRLAKSGASPCRAKGSWMARSSSATCSVSACTWARRASMSRRLPRAPPGAARRRGAGSRSTRAAAFRAAWGQEGESAPWRARPPRPRHAPLPPPRGRGRRAGTPTRRDAPPRRSSATPRGSRP